MSERNRLEVEVSLEIMLQRSSPHNSRLLGDLPRPGSQTACAFGTKGEVLYDLGQVPHIR